MPINKYSEDRPWGNFVQFCKNELCTVKIMELKPNSSLSRQYHERRDEFIRVLSGEARFVMGEAEKIGKPGDEFFIPRLAVHRTITAESGVVYLEISLGEFDENDIVRLEDRYNRV